METLHEIPLILVCGFEPFQNQKINPSKKLIQELEKVKANTKGFDNFKTVILPVGFKEAPEILKGKIQEFKPSKVLMLGQAGGATQIRLERVALNWQETSSADEFGFCPSTGKIAESGKEVYFSTMDLPRLRRQLEGLSIPVEISLSAGGFVCNRLYYEFFNQCGARVPGLFVHFPFLEEQLVGNSEGKFLPWETQQKAFWEILKFFKE